MFVEVFKFVLLLKKQYFYSFVNQLTEMYAKLFFTFLKIGLFTIGGGYAMVPLIEREVIKNNWIKKEDFYDIFAVTQSLPGVFAVNISVFVGYRLKKLKGSFVCALGTILPSFIIILAIATFFTQVQDNIWVEKIFKGLRPAVVALIAVPCISAAKATKLTYKTAIIPIAAAILIWYFNVSPVIIIILGCAGGLIYRMSKKKY